MAMAAVRPPIPPPMIRTLACCNDRALPPRETFGGPYVPEPVGTGYCFYTNSFGALILRIRVPDQPGAALRKPGRTHAQRAAKAGGHKNRRVSRRSRRSNLERAV